MLPLLLLSLLLPQNSDLDKYKKRIAHTIIKYAILGILEVVFVVKIGIQVIFLGKTIKIENQQIIGMNTDYLLISHHDGLIQFRHIQYQCLWQPIFHALVPMERLFL